MSIILEHWKTLLHVLALLTYRKRCESAIHQFFDGGRPHVHRCGKKPGDKEYHDANQLKQKCKKKYFQGIHDRFLRDPEFRRRMIENNRDEELCRKWDALADEDHTHHLTPQEHSFYRSNWWLPSNKQGSNTVPVTHRPDFKKGIVNLAAIETKRRALQTSTNSDRNQQWTHKALLHSGIGKVHGGLLIPIKSRWR